jgi:ABC-type antimicrobial peptide transport system permease subunit
MLYACGLPSFWPDPEYLLKTSADPGMLANAVRREINRIEPTRAVFNVKPLTLHLIDTYSESRFQTMLLTLFAGTALLLAGIGLYSVMAYFVAQRTREIGLRMALGARPLQVLAQVIRQGAWITAIGLSAGVLAALAVSRSMASLLFTIDPTDAVTFLAAPAVLAVVAFIASVVPAHRATQVDPIEALRED